MCTHISMEGYMYSYHIVQCGLVYRHRRTCSSATVYSTVYANVV